MMLYRNQKTGAVIKSGCKISGGGWELVKTGPTAGKDQQEGAASGEKAAPKTAGKGKK